jgi:hypothetical protein
MQRLVICLSKFSKQSSTGYHHGAKVIGKINQFQDGMWVSKGFPENNVCFCNEDVEKMGSHHFTITI